MNMAMPAPATRLDQIKTLWRELQHTRPTSDRYQELVGLIHAETSAHLTAMAEHPGPRTKA